MEGKDFYRAIVVGPTGAGKSQFCNFIQRDLSNSINKVSDDLDSCTKDPSSNIFTRNNIKYEFIDTAGSSDSSKDDIKNLETLINYIKKKEEIDYIVLLLKFGERMSGCTREYLNTLGKIFTADEFYKHLCVFFTKFPLKPKKKEIELKEKNIKEINRILKEIFEIEENSPIPYIKVYHIDTDIDEDDNTYDEISQNSIDIMMKQMGLDVDKFGAIDTKNFDITGKRIENDKEENKKLKKMLEEEILKKEKEEEEKKRLQEEIKKMKESDEKRKKEENLKVLEEKEKKERQESEAFLKKNQEIIQKHQERQKKIDEEARKKGVDISKLDDNIDYYLKGFKILGGGGVISFASGFGVSALFGFHLTSSALLNMAIDGALMGGLGGIALASIPLLIAAGYKLTKTLSK